MNMRDGENIDNILLTYLQKNTFSGCAAAVSRTQDTSFFTQYYFSGKTNTTPKAQLISHKTFFDLASLTKPLVTVLTLLYLQKAKKIDFKKRFSAYLPFPVSENKRNIRIIDLIRHTSGLPAHRPYFLDVSTDKKKPKLEDIILRILGEELLFLPGDDYLYSDLDYIVLGYIIEEVCGEPLGPLWLNSIAGPLGLGDEFYVQEDGAHRKNSRVFAVTGRCGWSGVELSGVVHDDNCRALGRMCGHAGLFGTIKGVVSLCEEIYLNFSGRKQSNLFNDNDLLYLVKDRSKQHWAYGFDVPTGTQPSCGKHFSKRTVGHLGYTGTSFWIDLRRGTIAVILTNRVLLGSDKQLIQKMRPHVHDALLSASEQKET